jgi:hypothetical protein
MAESLNRVACTYLDAGAYVFDYIDQIVRDIGEALGVDFSQKYLQLEEIKKYWEQPKNRLFCNNFYHSKTPSKH